MFCIGVRALHCLHASVAILIPIFYWLVGLCCLLSEFNQREIMVLGVVQLLIFLAFHAAQRLNGRYKVLLSFTGFVSLGLLLVLVVAMNCWRADTADRYVSFVLPGVGNVSWPIFLLPGVGSVSWSIVAWECDAFLHCIRACRAHVTFPSIARRDQFLVLTIPMIMCGIVGIIYAVMGDALGLSEQLADFFHVEIIGVACGLFLALPWFSLPFALKLWTEKTASGTDKGTEVAC